MRPLDHLSAAAGLYPNAWRLVDDLRADRGKGLPLWPPWCFLPLAGWYAIVSADAGVDRLPPHMVPDAARLAAIGTWRYTKGIYRYDDDARWALAGTVLHGEMPVDVLLRLPEWSVYIETPGREWLGSVLHGFWAHLEWDANTQRRELRFLLDLDDGLIPQILHMGPWTITEAIDRWISEAHRQAQLHNLGTVPDTTYAVEVMSAAVLPLVSLLLYLCSDEPEVQDRDEPEARPGRPQPKRTKNGWRLFEARKPRIWTVGAGIGEALRRAAQDEATGRTVRAHVRRAHWHGYWTGARGSDDRRFRYRWLSPMVVGGGEK